MLNTCAKLAKEDTSGIVLVCVSPRWFADHFCHPRGVKFHNQWKVPACAKGIHNAGRLTADCCLPSDVLQSQWKHNLLKKGPHRRFWWWKRCKCKSRGWGHRVSDVAPWQEPSWRHEFGVGLGHRGGGPPACIRLLHWTVMRMDGATGQPHGWPCLPGIPSL